MPAKDRDDLRTTEWRKLTKYILERDAETCYRCQGIADTVDHIIPRSKGGGNNPGNLRAMCRSCNSAKGDKVETRSNWTNSRWGVRLR
jgi:5-methylcytosine-specific restriction endonuclease McrA